MNIINVDDIHRSNSGSGPPHKVPQHTSPWQEEPLFTAADLKSLTMGLYVCAVLVGVLLLATLAIAEDNQCLYGGGVNPALLQHEQQVARDRQGVIPCNVNDTDIEAFVQRVRTRMELLGSLFM